MAPETDSLLLAYMHRFDEKLDRVIDDVRELKIRLSAVEENLAGVHRRIDRVEFRLDRIEKRLDLVELPH